MLVLSRQRGEVICIGDPSPNVPPPIEIMIVDIRGDKVRIGITAPRGIPVHREEVFQEIHAEHLASAAGGGSVRFDPDTRRREVEE